jgi:hypothetical protein
MLFHHNAKQNFNIKVADRSFENVEKFKYFGTTPKAHDLIREEI